MQAAREEVPSSEREAGKKEEVAEVVEKVVEASEGDEVAVLKTKLAELEEENGRLRSERHHVTGDLPDGQQQEEEARRVEEGQKEHEGYKHVLESRCGGGSRRREVFQIVTPPVCLFVFYL